MAVKTERERERENMCVCVHLSNIIHITSYLLTYNVQCVKFGGVVNGTELVVHFVPSVLQHSGKRNSR